MAAAALHHGLTIAAGSVPGMKGGYFGVIHTYPSELAQTFWTAIVAWVTCFVVTILVSLVTRPRAEVELKGLVYSLTPRQVDTEHVWWKRPLTLGIAVLALTFALNLIFA